MERDAFLHDQARLWFSLESLGLASGTAAGLGYLVRRTPFAAGLELQALVWGAVDVGGAVVAWRSARKARFRVASVADWQAERLRLRSTLLLDTVLDGVYVLAGAALRWFGRRRFVQGTGIGIVIQGGFLLVFDALGSLALAP